LDTIADYLSKDSAPYAMFTTIVNSSGTGKSRMVDQLGKDVIVVPMCLRQIKSSGFPFCFIFISMACLQSDQGFLLLMQVSATGFVLTLATGLLLRRGYMGSYVLF
jgi:hypothetical protein